MNFETALTEDSEAAKSIGNLVGQPVQDAQRIFSGHQLLLKLIRNRMQQLA